MKVSVKYSGPGTSAQTWFESLTKDMISKMSEAVSDGIEEGSEIAKDNIETRGTLKSGKRGRIESGDMLKDVGHEITRKDKTGVSGKFGWIGNFEKYYGLQEDGFEHVGGVTVDGMYALRDAGEEVFANIEDEADRIIRGS